jgi:type VI secretion system secreted protein VgrG
MPSQPDLSISLELAEGAITSGLWVEAIDGLERLSTPYRFEVTFRSDDTIDPERVIGRGAKLTLDSPAGDLPVHGLVTALESFDPFENQGSAYRAVIAPRLSVLALSGQNRVYGSDQAIDVADVIDALTGGSAWYGQATDRGFDTLTNLVETYPTRDFAIQFRESDLAFLSRWCEHFGVFYFFTQESDGEKVVFADANTAFVEPTLPGPIVAQPAGAGAAEVPYRPMRSLDLAREPAVISFGLQMRAVTKDIAVKDYNPDQPSLSLRTTKPVSGGTSGTWVTYGDHFDDTSKGERFARIRAEEIACRRKLFAGRANAPGLRPGTYFRLSQHPNLNGTYVVVSARHRIVTPAPMGYSALGSAAEGSPYTNSFEAVPYDLPYRPERVTPKPTIAGVVVATVDGSGSGARAEIDDKGRYRVRLHFDEANLPAMQASSALRKAEIYAGPGDGANRLATGLHFPLLKGTEVLLTFINGDIDRPVIVGAVANGAMLNVVNQGNHIVNQIRMPSGSLFEINDGLAPAPSTPTPAPTTP